MNEILAVKIFTDINTLGIPIATLSLSIILLWFLIGTKGNWAIKAFITGLTIYFAICAWSSLNSLLGWPSAESVAGKKVQILWVDVKEPNKKTYEPGAIYIWVKYMEPQKTKKSIIVRLHTKESSDEPRIHKIPYSRKTHQQAAAIKKQIASGRPFFGEIKKEGIQGPQGKGKGQGKGQGKSKGGREGKGKNKGMNGGGSISQEQEMMFHQLPAPSFQSKDGY